MKRAIIGAAVSVLLACGRVGADVTYLSQDRFIKGGGVYSVPTALAPPGSVPTKGGTVVSATDMGPFSTTLGQAMQISSFDQNGIRARGESGISAPTGPLGNLYLNYTYGLSQTKVVFQVDEPTPFSSTWQFPHGVGFTGPLVSLDGPGGQHFDLVGANRSTGAPAPISGVLAPGDWTFLAFADAVNSPGIYNVNVSFVPEPGALMPIAIVAGLFVRRRRD